MQIVDRLLPPHCYGGHIKPQGLVVHYFSCINVTPSDPYNVDLCLDLFHDLNSPWDRRKRYRLPESQGRLYASAHLLIPREGQAIRLVPEECKAYHAGRSEYQGRKSWNRFSIGVELIGSAESGFTDYQYEALAWYVSYCMARYGFDFESVVGHEQIAPGRKADPGIATGNFNWSRLEQLVTAKPFQ